MMNLKTFVSRSLLSKTRGPALGALLGGVLLSGCGMMAAKDHKPEPVIARALPPPTPRTDGAIYQAGQQMELFADLKARRVGDI